MRGLTAAVITVLVAAGGCSSDDANADPQPTSTDPTTSAPAAPETTAAPEASFVDQARAISGSDLTDDDQVVTDLGQIVCQRYTDLSVDQAETIVMDTLDDTGAFTDEDARREFMFLAVSELCPEVAALD